MPCARYGYITPSPTSILLSGGIAGSFSCRSIDGFHERIREGGGLELEAVDVDPLPLEVKHHIIIPLRPRLAGIVEEVKERM